MREKLGTIVVNVVGRPMSGKSAVVSQIAHHLKSLGFEIEIEWGLDGEPISHLDTKKLSDKTNNVRERSKVIIKEKQAPRLDPKDA